MKTQFSFQQSGFTMIEIMVVIAIIGTLFASLGRINFRPQENIVKAERLASKIQSIIHSSNVSLMMGRMDNSPSPTATTGATIIISVSGSLSGNMVSWQLAPTLSGKIQTPFFDNDPVYEIRSIKGCLGGSTAPGSSGTTDRIEISMKKNSISFTGTSIPVDANILEVNVRYVNMEKKVIFDRRTGRTEIRRSGEDLCDN